MMRFRELYEGVYEVELLDASDEELMEISGQMGLALSLEEMRKIKEYFRMNGRNPTDVELQSLGQAWSEHCCYKSSKYFLKQHILGIGSRDVLLRGDAGVVRFDGKHAYVLKMESHNHPSAVEPYGGAATGVGGILRDIACMGAQPIALIDSLFFGPIDAEHVPRGVKHPSYLFQMVVKGISDYGNRVGIPTCAGMLYFHQGYITNCLVNVGCVGIAKLRKIVRNRLGAGELLMLVGGRTGRDGIHGVTFASAELDERAEEMRSAVQLGNPIIKEPLLHAILEVVERGLARGLKDLGGGGLSCVVGEMAYAGGVGAEVHLEKVLVKEPGMSPWEIWVSESQERFMIALRRDDAEKVKKIMDDWDIESSIIGRAIDQRLIRVFYNRKKVLEMDVDFLVSGPEYVRPCKTGAGKERGRMASFAEPSNYARVLLKILSSQNVCSREWVIRHYDHEVRACTVVKPLHGKIGFWTHGDATVLKPLENSYRGIAIASDSCPSVAEIDPFWGGAYVVDEVCRNLVSVGARPHSMTDCLNFGNPEDPEVMWEFQEVCRGMGYVASHLKLPFVSGNVSFYNEFRESRVPPTPVIVGVGIVEDVRRCVSSDFKREGNPIYAIGYPRPELGGSEYSRIRGISGVAPRVDPEVLKRRIRELRRAIKSGMVASCHDVSDGGIGACIAEMAIGGNVGAEIDLESYGSLRSDVKMFSESASRWVVEVKRGMERKFENTVKDAVRIGVCSGNELVIRDGRELVRIGVDELSDAWRKTIPSLVGR